MAKFEGKSYTDLIRMILEASWVRIFGDNDKAKLEEIQKRLQECKLNGTDFSEGSSSSTNHDSGRFSEEEDDNHSPNRSISPPT